MNNSNNRSMRSSLMVSILLLFLYASNDNLFAQESKSSFLFKDSKAKLSTFYAEINPGTSFSYLNKQMASIGELSAGLILNNRFSVSYFMTGSPKINTVAIPEPFTEEWIDWVEAGVELEKVSANAEFLYVKFKHSGLRFAYLHNTQKVLFWRGGVGLGFLGGLNMTEDQTFLGLLDNKVWESGIITLEPYVGLGVNLLPWWRFHLDLGYRWISVDENILKSNNTDSFSFKLGFSFGNFNYK